VPLAAVVDPELVLPTMADAFGTDLAVAEYVDGRRMLALLDNLEQVLDAAPHVAALVAACPSLHLLVTSRAPLRIAGEHEYAVDPLPQDDAVALFRERAFDADPLDAVEEICRRVDRLPLAVELAAARTRLFSPPQLLERLARRLPLLDDGRRDAPARHQGLRATIAWSHDLLPPDVRELFARLGVFAGPFDLDAAEVVAGATLDGMEGLVESSLVRRLRDRFTMLETIREYAVEQLDASENSHGVHDRHLRYFLDKAEVRAQALAGLQVGTELRLSRLDEDDTRAAITWATATAAAEEAMRLCSALTDAWNLSSHIEEGLRWFEGALEIGQHAAAPIRAKALAQYGSLLMFANRPQESSARLEESVALYRSLADHEGLAHALVALGSTVSGRDPSRAGPILEEALEVSRRAAFRTGECRVLHLLGEMRRDQGEYDEGAELLDRALEVATEMGWRRQVGATLHSLADLELDRAELDRAEALYQDCLRLAREDDLDRYLAYCVAGLAAVAAKRADNERAAYLWSALERNEGEHGFRLIAYERERYERILADVPSWSGEPPDLDEAVHLALGPT
ncbi:MAG TPA: tetratricopeptide repeat protein, partial [Nocardioidaceae bacterium]|nr:tetratricopeptide repeat protein [Nocardioidaceae bacterium]